MSGALSVSNLRGGVRRPIHSKQITYLLRGKPGVLVVVLLPFEAPMSEPLHMADISFNTMRYPTLNTR